MLTTQELEELFIGICLEGFFYGKISVLCASTCTLAKYVPTWTWIIPRSRTLLRDIRYLFTMHIENVQDANHPFLCSLHSLRSIYCYHCRWFNKSHIWSKWQLYLYDFFNKYQVQFRISKLSLQLQNDSMPMLFHLGIVQIIASGCCDFIAQCIIVRIMIISIIHIFTKDLPLLDHVESRYPFRDHPFILGNCILRSVNIHLHFI